MLTADGHLLSSALVGRGCFPSFSALVGRVGGWRSSGCAVRAHKQIICVINAICRRFRVRVV